MSAMKTKDWGFPGGLVVKNLPANAGDMGSIPGFRRIPHTSEKLSLCATSTEATRPRTCVSHRRSLCTARESSPHCNWRKPSHSNEDPEQSKIHTYIHTFLPGKSHGQRRLAGYGPKGHKELDMTE